MRPVTLIHRATPPILRLILLAAGILLCGQEASGSDLDSRTAIQAVLDKQIQAWNRGDMEGFMAGYWNSPNLVYLSNRTVVRGWQTLLKRYKEIFKKPEGLQMGQLELSEEEIMPLSNDIALVWGTFHIKTTNGKNRGGLYTLVMRKLPEGWLAVYDRTSSEAEQ